MKEKQYTIQGIKLHMGEMTLGQDKKLLDILADKKINFGEMTGIQKTIKYLIKEDLLDDLLKTILKGEVDSIVMDDLTNSQLEEIISDFFELNGKWISKLNGLLDVFLKMMNLTIPSPNSKTTPSPDSSTTE